MKQYLPYIFLITGAVFSTVGAIWIAFNSADKADQLSKLNIKITDQAVEISDLSKEIARKSDIIAELTKSTLNSVTGGDSYCYVMPLLDRSKNVGTFLLQHRGNYPIHNVDIFIRDRSAFANFPPTPKPRDQMSPKDWEDLLKVRDLGAEFDALARRTDRTINIGTFVPGTARSITTYTLSAMPKYFIRIFALNGIIEQEIVIKKIGEDWRFSTRAIQTLLGERPKVVWESIHPEIPLTMQ